MAPRPPTRKARDNDYSNIGTAGRRTGVTVGELKKDEHGLEVIDGLFSSPRKSPVKQNGLNFNSTIDTPSEMEVGNSTIPEPTETLTARKSLRGAMQLPPRSRSPIKTSLSGTPRRTPLSRASIPPDSEDTPTRGSSRLLTARRMDFSSQGTPQQSLRRAPLQEMRGNSVSPTRANGVQKAKSPVFQEQENELSAVAAFSDDEELPVINVPMKVRQSIETAENGYDDSYLMPNGDDSIQEIVMQNVDAILNEAREEKKAEEENVPEEEQELEEEQDSEEEGLEQEAEIQSDVESDNYQEEEEEVPPSSPVPEPLKGGRKRKSDEIEPAVQASKKSKGKERAISPSEELDLPIRASATKPKSKARGRPPKAKSSGVHRDTPSASISQSPHPVQPTKTKANKTTKRAAGQRKDPNTQLSSRQASDLADVVKKHTTARGPHNKSRSLYILKRETPFDDSTTHTRSGRVSVKPVAYWRNERCVYGESEVEAGQRFPLTTIKEVIRTEEVDRPKWKSQKGKKGSKNKGKGSKSKKVQDSESEDSSNAENDPVAALDSDASDWESSPGILHTLVRRWDPNLQNSTHDAEEIDLAYSAPAIQTKEVHGSTFRYAKLTGMPWFGSGVVDLPPGGVKRPKNSRRFHMVFYVASGRVKVDVAGRSFGVGVGGMWQVPRGNQYHIENPYKKSARIFFSQGCESVPEGAAVGTQQTDEGYRTQRR